MLDREEVLCKAYEDCIREMFAKAQPSADWDNIIEEYKAGKIDEKKDGPIYDRHYLSAEEFKYILDKYMKAYRIESEWKDDIEILEDYLNKGGNKDKYIEAWEDEHGHHPGYRSYEEVPPLKQLIANYIRGHMIMKGEPEENIQYWAKSITDIVMNDISTCKNYYSFNVDEQKFRNTVCMRCSPTGSIETVKKWWKDHYDIDIEIEERNPLLFWEQDYYGDEFEEIMEEEDGPDWKEKWDKKWKDQVAKKKEENEKRLKELQEKYEKEKNETKE
jgi:hypothetical protein